MSDKDQFFLLRFELISWVVLFVAVFLFGSSLYVFAADDRFPVSASVYENGSYLTTCSITASDRDAPVALVPVYQYINGWLHRIQFYAVSTEPCVFIYNFNGSSPSFTLHAVSGYDGYYIGFCGAVQKNSGSYSNVTSDVPMLPFASKEYSEAEIASFVVENNLLGSSDPDFDDYEYSFDLGVLMGMERLSRDYSLKNSDNTFRERGTRFSWENQTSTGINLYSNDWDSLQIQAALFGIRYDRDSMGNKTVVDKQQYYYDPVDASVDNIQISWTELRQVLPDIYKINSLNDTSETFAYFRLLGQKDGNYYRGNWVRVNFKSTGNEDELTATAVSGSGIGDDFEADVTSPYGQGSSYTQNRIEGYTEHDVTHSITTEIGGVGGMINTMEELLNQVGYIPKIVSILFSWLPPWCLALFSTAMALSVAMLVIKIVRG